MWQPGAVYVDRFALRPTDAGTPGAYTVEVGLVSGRQASPLLPVATVELQGRAAAALGE